MLIDQLHHLTSCLFDPNDVIELRHLHPSGDQRLARQSWHLASNLHAVCEPIEHQNLTHNCYFGCNPRKGIGSSKADGVRLARVLGVEWDETSWPRAWQKITAAGLPDPTLVIWSGGGPHAYWRLIEPITSLGMWSMYQKALIRLLGSDGCIHDAPRIMRLPGTWNHKRMTFAKVLWAEPGARYRVDEVLCRVPVVERVPKRKPMTPVQCKTNYATAALLRECKLVESTPFGQRHHALVRSSFKIGQLVGAGLLDPSQAFCAMLDATQSWNSHPSIEGPKIMQQIEYGMQHPRVVELKSAAA